MCECSVGVDVRNEARVLPANAIDFHKFLRWNAGSYLHLQREGSQNYRGVQVVFRPNVWGGLKLSYK
jgi:hypothetical protein